MEPQIKIGLSVHNIQLQFRQSMNVALQGECAKIQWALLYFAESETCALPTHSPFHMYADMSYLASFFHFKR